MPCRQLSPGDPAGPGLRTQLAGGPRESLQGRAQAVRPGVAAALGLRPSTLGGLVVTLVSIALPAPPAADGTSWR